MKLYPEHTCTIRGEAWFDQKNLVEFGEMEMRRVRGKEIGMIFQDPMTSLNPTLKIGTQIMEGYLHHHPEASLADAKRRAIEMLELFGIAQAQERLDAYPHTLSGGMRQRVMIALAQISNPKILIADEPTTALDVTIQAQILDLMKNIQQKTRTSIILISHDLSVVAGFCDRVLVMYAGKIVEDAPVEKLFKNPQHPYTQRLLQSIPRLDMSKNEPLIPIEGTPPDLAHPIQGCAFWKRCTNAMQICPHTSPEGFCVDRDHISFCWKHAPRGGSS